MEIIHVIIASIKIKKINDLILEEKYEFVPDEKIVKFYLYLSDKTSEDKNNRIGFILKLDKKKDKNEYIEFLIELIRKSHNIINKNQLKSKNNFTVNKNGEKLKFTSDNKVDMDEIVETKDEEKLISFNCNKCPLIPEIHINLKIKPVIESICPNKHLNKGIDLSYLRI